MGPRAGENGCQGTGDVHTKQETTYTRYVATCRRVTHLLKRFQKKNEKVTKYCFPSRIEQRLALKGKGKVHPRTGHKGQKGE